MEPSQSPLAPSSSTDALLAEALDELVEDVVLSEALGELHDEDDILADALRSLEAQAISTPEEREMLGLSMRTVTHALVELCAECGCPVHEERQYGTGAHAGVRRPTAHDIKRPVLLEHTAHFVCTRDGQKGAALIDVLEDRAGPGSVGPALLMLS